MALPTVTPRTTITELAKQINSEIERLEGEISSLKSTAEYLLALGKEGGQTVYGGTKARENLKLESTSGYPKGKINLADTLYIDETNKRIGIGTDSPSEKIVIEGDENVLAHLTGVGAKVLKITSENGLATELNFERIGGAIWFFRHLSGGDFAITVSTSAVPEFRIKPSGEIGIGKVPGSGNKLDIDLSTQDFAISDAGITGATEAGWVEVSIGGIEGFLRMYTTK